jgi:hypothetical protein
MRLGRAVLGVVGALTLVAVAFPAVADPVTYYQMPFPCGEKWTGTTRAHHSPSSKAIDWNRPDDLGDRVVASAPGTVTVADKINNSGYGRWVTIDHGRNEKTLYAHLSAVNVTVGQRVDQGELIGLLGSTGNSSGPHLHFEERSGSSVVTPFFAGVRFVFGSTLTSKNCVEVPMAVDWNGDGKAEPTVFRRADPAAFRIYRSGRTPITKRYGTAADDPVPGDWDGNGTVNVGVRNPSSKTFTMRTPRGNVTLLFGLATDKPIAGDWDGDKKWTPGLWRPNEHQFILRHADGAVTRIYLGDADDLPVTGDWDGDGRTDVGVYDQATATFTLRKTDEDGLEWTARVPFGTAGDLPAVGDWDGNGKTDLGVWSPRSGVFTQRKAPSPSAKLRSTATVKFGQRRR